MCFASPLKAYDRSVLLYLVMRYRTVFYCSFQAVEGSTLKTLTNHTSKMDIRIVYGLCTHCAYVFFAIYPKS